MNELGRRAVHASGTLLPLAFLADVLTYEQVRLVLVVSSAVVVILEALRLGLDAVPRPMDHLYAELTREYEQDNPAGYALYTFSMTVVALIFPAYAAVPGMLMLTLGDPISGVLGSAGPGGRKRLAVMTVMFAVCFVLALLAVLALRPDASAAVLAAAAAVGALGATLADGFKPIIAGYVLDDNATIPPLAALGLFAVIWLG